VAVLQPFYEANLVSESMRVCEGKHSG
jgi:hypothetical protein